MGSLALLVLLGLLRWREGGVVWVRLVWVVVVWVVVMGLAVLVRTGEEQGAGGRGRMVREEVVVVKGLARAERRPRARERRRDGELAAIVDGWLLALEKVAEPGCDLVCWVDAVGRRLSRGIWDGFGKVAKLQWKFRRSSTSLQGFKRGRGHGPIEC